MKTKLHALTLVAVLLSNAIFAQGNDLKFLDDYTNLYLETNINFSSSTEDSRSDAQAGIGTLGIKFDRKFIYGKILFTVFSKNDKIESETINDIKIFGSNLLIPSNSSNSVSNFSFLLGTKSFYKFESVQDESIEFFDWRRFGGYGQFSIYNTEWIKGELKMPVTTTMLDLHVTYRLLSLQIEGENNGRADFYVLAGYSNRRLGGDYGLGSNKELRKEFIDTEKLGFNAFNLGARLEISNFFGQVNLTNFGNGNIPGFSGNQAVITLGFNANLNLRAKNKMKSKALEKKLSNSTDKTKNDSIKNPTEPNDRHLKFKEIPIDDSLHSFVSQLKKQNFKLIKTNESDAILFGKFANEDVDIFVKATPKTVYEVTVKFNEKDSWKSVKSQYENIKEELIKKYGKPKQTIENFDSDTYEKSGSELIALREEKCNYISIFNVDSDKDIIKLSISPEAKLVINYIDTINFQEIGKQAYNDL